jgi:hypothetical protein
MPGRTINGLAGPSRKRRADEDNDEEEIEVQQASSKLQTDAVCFSQAPAYNMVVKY